MKLSLSLKFVITYIVLGITGFVLLNTEGLHMMGNHIINNESSRLYTSAVSLSSTKVIRSYQNTESLEYAHEMLQAVADTEQVDIMIIDSQGQLVLDTSTPLADIRSDALTGFDPTASKNSYYTIDDYFGYYTEDHLNVTVPITINMSTRGYIALHEPYSHILAEREKLLELIVKFYAAGLILFCLPLVLLLLIVHRPLKKIINGAREFASGNLEYQIPIHTADEMGYLSNTLNYMADEMRQNDQFQKNFISNVSHDFRSPLTSIKGYVEAILDGTIPHEMQDRYLKIVLFETSRLTKLTQGMLQLNDLDAKAYMLNIQDFDLNQLIKNTAASFEGTCREKHISIELLLASPKEFVSADMEKIQQVMYNLIDNAIKFSDKHAMITIETTRKNELVFVSVKDQGSGIPQKDLSKIWNRFYKQDLSRGKDRTGTGLGLSIVKEIINTHKQNINVISTEGVGTEFIFTLARAKSKDVRES